MIKEIKLPEIADNVDVATVISIRVSEGDTVSKDDTLAEMESDKAAFDLPSEVNGKVKEIKVKEGDEIKVGQVVITVETDEGEAKSDTGDDKEEDEKQQNEEKKKGDEEHDEEEVRKTDDEREQKVDKSKKKDEPGGDDQKEHDETKEQDKSKEDDTDDDKTSDSVEQKAKEVPASPSVRRLARELGVDVYKVEGAGPYDRIMADDVKAYAKAIIQITGEDFSLHDDYELPDFSKYGETVRKPMDSIRKRTAGNMTASWQSIPHVFQFDKADVTQLEEFRKKYAKQVEREGGKLTVTSILIKILARALEAFPKFNASLDYKNKEIIYKKYINIGVAVDTARGLLVPVIRHADKKSITELSIETGELAEKARNKKIMPDDLQGGNMAISNLGGIGGTNFTPIVYRPNVAILGVSRSEVQPVYIDGEFQARTILPLSLSYDHRIIDGAEAARFLRWICESLENPLLTMF